jgi:hypothetical protein
MEDIRLEFAEEREKEEKAREKIEDFLISKGEKDLEKALTSGEIPEYLSERRDGETYDEWLERMDYLARESLESIIQTADAKTRKATADTIFELLGRKKGKASGDVGTQNNIFMLGDESAKRIAQAAKGMLGEREVNGTVEDV